jgi:tRNA-2-methylthio-N6-dimethylallyladenosine synthase
MAFMFKYSEREGTVAKRNLKDDVSEEEKSDRLTELVELQTKISHQLNESRIGSIYEVLVEDRSKKSAKEASGRTNSGRMVVFPMLENQTLDSILGKIITVKIDSASSATLRGKIYES